MDLSSFLAELAKSPALRDKFIEDPVSVANQFDLSEADRQKLQSKDQASIDAAMKGKDAPPWIIAKWIIEKK